MSRRAAHRAFTLAEIIVAVVITSLLAGATTIAITQAVRSRDASAARLQAFSRAHGAAERIAADILTVVRDANLQYARVRITPGGSPDAERDDLLVYSRSMTLVRPRSETPEGGEYEVQYRLEPVPPFVQAPPSPGGSSAGANTGLILWRRADPVPDDIPDGGGVATALVDGIVSLSFRAYDGSDWFDQWDSDQVGAPHAVSVTVSATDDRGRYVLSSRRIVAIDRTPLPIDTSAAADSTQQPTTGAGGTTSAPATGGSSGGGAGGGGSGGNRGGGGGG